MDNESNGEQTSDNVINPEDETLVLEPGRSIRRIRNYER